MFQWILRRKQDIASPERYRAARFSLSLCRMARSYGLLGLVVVLLAVLVVVPLLKNLFPAAFPYEGFRDLDCAGVTCAEGQFCQENKCIPIFVQ